MKALWLEDRQARLRDDLPLPQPGPDEALVKVRLAGVCSTDLEMVKGYYPFRGVMGHEFVGEVAAGPADWVGQRVAGEINVVCNQCAACRAGRPTHCEQRTVIGISGRDGIFAEYTCLPIANLHRVPPGVSDEQAVFTEPLAAALEIQQQGAIRPDDRVLLVGAGRLGQLIAQTLALSGCRLQVVVRHEQPRRLLGERGITVLHPSQVAARAYDVVIEATGSPDGFNLARQALRPRGILVLKSTYAGDLQVNMSSIVVDEITLLGSRCGPFEPALRLLEHGLVDPRPLIAARYPLVDGLAALEWAAQPGTLKVLIEP